MPGIQDNSNKFEQYQRELQETRLSHIDACLEDMRSSHVSFKHVSHLAAMVASYLSQVEGKPCARSTLQRNLLYRARLLGYMADEMPPGVKNIVGHLADEAVVQALLTQKQLEVANLQRENRRLKSYISELSTRSINSDASVTQPNHVADNSDFIRTCQVLVRVLDNFDDLISIDFEKSSVLDATRISNRVIAEPQLMAPFISWLQANKTR